MKLSHVKSRVHVPDDFDYLRSRKAIHPSCPTADNDYCECTLDQGTFGESKPARWLADQLSTPEHLRHIRSVSALLEKYNRRLNILENMFRREHLAIVWGVGSAYERPIQKHFHELAVVVVKALKKETSTKVFSHEWPQKIKDCVNNLVTAKTNKLLKTLVDWRRRGKIDISDCGF